jgi:F-type H+-transporting ATPase subunit delta
MSDHRAASRYAKALFDLAEDRQRLDPLRADLRTLDALLNSSPELRKFLENRMISPTRRLEILGELFGKQGQAEPLLTTFLLFLEEKRRLSLLPTILAEFEARYEKSRSILRVRVTSARPLAEAQLQSIQQRLAARHHQQIIAETAVDPDLIGGFQIQIGDEVLDCSIETQLQKLNRKLAHA